MNDKKLYYTNPLHAAIMAQEFGVKFKTPRGQNMYWDGGSDFRTEKDCGVYGGEEYIINPDSYDIFKPIVGDLVQEKHNKMCWVVDESPIQLKGLVGVKPPSADYYKRADNRQGKAISNLKILIRNNKPFYSPTEQES